MKIKIITNGEEKEFDIDRYQDVELQGINESSYMPFAAHLAKHDVDTFLDDFSEHHDISDFVEDDGDGITWK